MMSGQDHPEAPARLHAIADQLLSSGLEYVIQQKDATAASDEQLALAHDPAYIQLGAAKTHRTLGEPGWMTIPPSWQNQSGLPVLLQGLW